MTQSRTMSLIEAKTSAIVGLAVSWLFTMYGLPLFGLAPTLSDATAITGVYFILSVGRSYAVRRMFNGRPA